MPQNFASTSKALLTPMLCFILLLGIHSTIAAQLQNDLRTPSKANTQERLESDLKVAGMMLEAEELAKQGEESAALKLWTEITEVDPSNQRALNQASFLSARIGNRMEGQEQDKYFWQAKDFAEQSLEINRQSAEANFVMAVAMGRIAEVAPARDRMAASRRIKQFAEKALEIDPDHPGAWHVLGLWHLRMSTMSVAEREAAKALYGETASGGTKAEAESAIKKAISLRPDYLLYRSDLARLYFAKGEREKARRELQTIMQMHANSPDDQVIKEKAKEKL